MEHDSPSVRKTAFNCPHCGAFAKQDWYSLQAVYSSEEKPPPNVIIRKRIGDELEQVKTEEREIHRQWLNKMADGFPFLEETDILSKRRYESLELRNIFVSECCRCKNISVWIYDNLVYPQRGEAPPANPDLPDDIRRDYNEASHILGLSPRGAAALIRLAIQKLCKKLGKPGKNLNDDIGALVKGGLDPRIQQALDIVRVIGNNAVHPGQIDLRDDRKTAESLFHFLNEIAEEMISKPKRVNQAYETLPENERKAIEKRDANNGARGRQTGEHD